METCCLVLERAFHLQPINCWNFRFPKIQDGGWRPSFVDWSSHKFATTLKINIVSGSMWGFHGRKANGENFGIQISMIVADSHHRYTMTLMSLQWVVQSIWTAINITQTTIAKTANVSVKNVRFNHAFTISMTSAIEKNSKTRVSCFHT